MPVLVDGIVSTARTIIAAARHLRAAGLAPPVCVGVHARLEARIVTKRGSEQTPKGLPP